MDIIFYCPTNQASTLSSIIVFLAEFVFALLAMVLNHYHAVLGYNFKTSLEKTRPKGHVGHVMRSDGAQSEGIRITRNWRCRDIPTPVYIFFEISDNHLQ